MIRALVVLLALAGPVTTFAQEPEAPIPPTDAEQVLAQEREWAAAIQRRDAAAMSGFLGDTYFLAIAVQDAPIVVVPRDTWLATLESYVTESYSLDHPHVHVYGDTAVVMMVLDQKATVRGLDRSGQFLITDIWVRTPDGWRVVERHSSRPEPQAASRPGSDG